LNFTASSWPSIGGIVAGAAFLVSIVALLIPLRHRRELVSALATAACVLIPIRLNAQVITVSTRGMTLAEAVRVAPPGATISIRPGHYIVQTLTIDKPLTLKGEGFPTIDGGGGEVIRISADGVAITGLRITGTGVSYTQDRAGIRITGNDCRIIGNHIDHTLYGIYLAKSNGCRIEGNTLVASGRTEATSGNGIHLWSSRGVTIAGNRISHFRDGIYFEFVHDTRVERNVSEQNLRYGLHFMESDDCEYVGNDFRSNGAGVAVMYTKRVRMTGNRFEMNRGSSAYGLLLNEVENARIEHNTFASNTTGLYADGADNIEAISNKFILNGWAVKLGGSTTGGEFARNDFVDNTFDVTTSSREPSTKFAGNYWSSYSGYDLNRDGIGDVPHPPVRLFAVIIERNPQSVILMRSLLAQILDMAERMMPALTPQLFLDSRPAMRKVA
jgi:nitrous oxidase accessory protein